VVFGPSEVTQGASGDLQMVSQLAREMVTRFGFSDLGPVALEGQDQEVFLGRDLVHTKQAYAESTGREIDRRVRALASGALQQAIDLLEPRRELMDRLVEALIEEETLQSDRFHELAGIDVPAQSPSLEQLPAGA
jgi:cell division protease FtsH